MKASLSLGKFRKIEPYNSHYQVTVQEISAIKKAYRVSISCKRTTLLLYKSQRHMHKFQSPSCPEDDTRIREITEKNGNQEDHKYKMATIYSIKPGG